MLTSTIFLSTMLTALAAALPATKVERAGGPAIATIPPTCTTSNTMPTTTGMSFVPGPAAESDELYSAHYPAFSSNTTLMQEQCLQQCYGYGDHTECKAAYWADNVPNQSGDLMAACLFYTRPLTMSDWQTAAKGQATSAYSRNLAC